MLQQFRLFNVSRVKDLIQKYVKKEKNSYLIKYIYLNFASFHVMEMSFICCYVLFVCYKCSYKINLSKAG